MKALSIRQPWAWLIVNNFKPIENRDWNDRYPGMRDARQLLESGDQFLIHAGKGMIKEEYDDAADTCRLICQAQPSRWNIVLPPFDALERGGIVGKARLHAIVRDHTSPWFFGPVGLLLMGAQSLPYQPLKGALGFFDVPESALVDAAVRAMGGEQ